MRTTVELDPDVVQALDRYCRERRLGLSEAANALMRLGLTATPEHDRFIQQTRPLGLRFDVANVAEALEAIDGEDAG